MSSLFHSNLLSSRFGQSFELPSPPSVQRTEKAEQKKSPTVRENVRMLFRLLPDLALFYFILTIDAVLTTKIFLCTLVGVQKSTAAE